MSAFEPRRWIMALWCIQAPVVPMGHVGITSCWLRLITYWLMRLTLSLKNWRKRWIGDSRYKSAGSLRWSVNAKPSLADDAFDQVIKVSRRLELSRTTVLFPEPQG